MDSIRKILYFSGSHWDREWYLSFQGFRFRLVKVMDEVLDTLARDPDFLVFVSDGQAIMLEDYLEIRPERAEELRGLLSGGRILMGPWYTMPDQNLTSGESLVMNLLHGFALTQDYGAPRPLMCGFVCDIFGHVAQLPQVLNGFGIKTALLGRGTNAAECPAFFRWQSPDGSGVTVFKVPEECGYGTFWQDVYLPYLQNPGLDRKQAHAFAEAYVARERARSPLPYVVLMDNMDHTGIHAQAPAILKALGERFSCETGFGRIDALLEEAGQAEGLPVLTGELQRTGQAMVIHHMLIPGTLSSRVDLKMANDHCEQLLEKQALPASALAAALGRPMPVRYQQTAYRYLLKNHAHDSICGCSIDTVGRDMHYRFRQARDIATRLYYESADAVLGDKPRDGAGEDLQVTLFNPLPWRDQRVLAVQLPFEPGYSERYDAMIPSEKRNSFRIYDAQGQECPWQLLDVRLDSYAYRFDYDYARKRDVYTVALQASLPAMGSAQFTVRPSHTPVRFMDSLRLGTYSAQNEWLRLDIAADGTLDLHCRRTGQAFPGLLDFADEGDTGDGWHHRAPDVDRRVLGRGAPARVSCVSDGPLACAFEVERVLLVPEAMDENRHYTLRGERAVPLTLTSRITLFKGARAAQVRLRVSNTCRDHRLKLLLPTGIREATWQAGQSFGVVERPVGRDPGTHDWKEVDKAEKAFAHIARKTRPDGSGFAFISAGGLHECAALAGGEGLLEITLLRAFSKTFLTDGEPDGQLQDVLEYEFLLAPTGPEDSFADLVRLRDTLCSRPFQRVVRGHGAGPERQHGIQVDSARSAVSVIKPREQGEGLLLRLVNLSGEEDEAVLTSALPLSGAWLCNLLEQEQESLECSGKGLSLSVKPWQILTVLLKTEAAP